MMKRPRDDDDNVTLKEEGLLPPSQIARTTDHDARDGGVKHVMYAAPVREMGALLLFGIARDCCD